jgi:hypothetical protein
MLKRNKLLAWAQSCMYVVSGRLPLQCNLSDDVNLNMQQGQGSPADNPDTAEQAAAHFDCSCAKPELCSLFRKRLAAAQARLLQVPYPCQTASSNLQATYMSMYTVSVSVPGLCSGTDNHECC